jgi:Gpi18-like mannosyltransferase
VRYAFTHIRHYYILAAAFFVGLLLFLPDSGYDKYFWVTWAQYIHQHGLSQAYNNPEINYHPVILFIIKGFTLFFADASAINYTNINWLKVPTALFDWGILFISLKILQEHKVNLQWGLLLALNPAFWYNTLVWGQFDSIWVFFTLLAFYFAKNNFHFSSLAFVLALNTKLFAVVFLPFLVLMWYKNRYPTVRQNVVSIVIAAALQVFFLLPFLFTTHYSLAEIINRSTGYYNSASRNAYNIWYYVYENPLTVADNDIALPAALFVVALFGGLLYLQHKNKASIWDIAALAGLVFFLFLTRMHERYACAVLVFGFLSLTPQPSLPKRLGALLAFILLSLAYLLNMEAVMQMAGKGLGWKIDYNGFIFNAKLIATLYVIALLLLTYTIIYPKPDKKGLE